MSRTSGQLRRTDNCEFNPHSNVKGSNPVLRDAMVQKDITIRVLQGEPISDLYTALANEYELKGRRLSITYSIRNDSDDVMPFGFGLHPAFNCPIDPAKSYEDYWLEFSNPETFDWKTTSLHNEKVLSIQDRDALANTIIVHEPVSSEASLTDGTHSVTVSCVGYEWLAFWSPRAPFVCIEPWHSHTDFEEVRVPFEKREGTILLDPHRTFTTAYTITVK